MQIPPTGFCAAASGISQSVDSWTSTILDDTDFLISTFGEDEDGELHVADYGSGSVLRITGLQ